MSLDEIRARTAARKAAGANQNYPHHSSRAAPAGPVPKRLVACADLGARVPGQPCGSPLLRCNRFGDITARFATCAGATRCCETCPEYRTAGADPVSGSDQSRLADESATDSVPA